MPFLRFARDKRGIETTSLLHSSRRHGSGKPRLLYWFRTPPEVRVGRAAIDEAVISALERAHPDVTFDWPQILHASKSQVSVGARRTRDERVEPGRRHRKTRGSRPEPASDRGRSEVVETQATEDASGGEAERHTASEAVVAVVSHDEGSRLRGRYAELLARIAERITDPARAEAFRAQAEALNPDAWVTPEEVARGLESFDANEQRLRQQLGRRRRARRGGSRHTRRAGSVAPPAAEGGPAPSGGSPPEEDT